jgi:hypothetical protein
MSDEATRSSEAEGGNDRGLSRRNALKAGVAAGVGVAAWSGATITSFGGTPAYATQAGCTGVIHVVITADCDNVDLADPCPSGQFSYQHLGVVTSGFGIANDFTNQTCCSDAAANPPSLTWTTPNLQCTTHVEIWEKLNPCRNGAPIVPNLLAHSETTGVGGANGGSAVIDTQCFQFTNPVPPGTPVPGGDVFYKVYANCNSVDAPQNCL